MAPGLAWSSTGIFSSRPNWWQADEVGILDEVGRADRFRPEPQVRHRHRTRLLRVVDEVALGEQVGVLADDLHRRLVGPDGAVGAEPEEHRLHLTGRPRVAEPVVGVEAQPGDIVVDADGEPPLRGAVVSPIEPGQLVEDRLDMGRAELLRGQPVAPADHVGRALEAEGHRSPSPHGVSRSRRAAAARPSPPAPWSDRARRSIARVGGRARTKCSAGNGR